MYAFALAGGAFFCYAIYHTCLREQKKPRVKRNAAYYKRRHQRRFSDTMEELDEWAKMKYDLDRLPVMKKIGYNPTEFEENENQDSDTDADTEDSVNEDSESSSDSENELSDHNSDEDDEIAAGDSSADEKQEIPEVQEVQEVQEEQEQKPEQEKPEEDKVPGLLCETCQVVTHDNELCKCDQEQILALD